MGWRHAISHKTQPTIIIKSVDSRLISTEQQEQFSRKAILAGKKRLASQNNHDKNGPPATYL